MCMHCSARCDKCKPAQMKGIICDQCGKAVVLSREDCLYGLGYFKVPTLPDGSPDPEYTKLYTCKNCGNDLSHALKETIKPLPCLYSNIICGYPCGKRKRPRRGNAEVCRKQVFAGRLPKEDQVEEEEDQKKAS